MYLFVFNYQRAVKSNPAEVMKEYDRRRAEIANFFLQLETVKTATVSLLN